MERWLRKAADAAALGTSTSISSVEIGSPRSSLICTRVTLDGDVLGDHRDDLFLQHGKQIGLADEGALMRQQHLQALARDRRRGAPAE